MAKKSSLDKQYAEIVQKSIGSLVDYRRLMLDTDENECESAPYHYRWSDILLYGKENFAIEGYRECAKSQLVLRDFPLHALTFPRKECSYICLLMANTKIASKKLKEIEREFVSNKVISANCKGIIEQSGDAFEAAFADPAEPTRTIKVRIEAYGKDGAIRGASWGTRRPDIIIIDDIQGVKDARSETVMGDDWKWFLDDIVFLGRKSRIFMIGNNLGERCVIERVHQMNNSGDAVKGVNFACEKVAAADGLTLDSNVSWPARHTMQDLIDERDAYRAAGELSIWTRNMMCECIADEDKVFTQDMFQYYVPSDARRIAQECNVYIRVDPSASVKESADYSAFVVFGINKDNNWFIFDVVYARMKQSEKIDAIFDLTMKWKPLNVGIENSKEGIILMQDVKEQRAARNIFMKVVEVTHGNKAKTARIEALQPRYESQTVWHPERAKWLAELEGELLMFSKEGKMTMHDDVIDALAYGLQKTRTPIDSTEFNSMKNNRFGKNLKRSNPITCLAR